MDGAEDDEIFIHIYRHSMPDALGLTDCKTFGPEGPTGALCYTIPHHHSTATDKDPAEGTAERCAGRLENKSHGSAREFWYDKGSTWKGGGQA
jgi:hypothetical protein